MAPVPVTSCPINPNPSSRVIGVMCGMLVCFFLLVITFCWWRKLFPILCELIGLMRDKATGYLSRDPPHIARPPVVQVTADIAPLVPILTVRRHRGSDSVDTLPLYTPSERPTPSLTDVPLAPEIKIN